MRGRWPSGCEKAHPGHTEVGTEASRAGFPLELVLMLCGVCFPTTVMATGYHGVVSRASEMP